NAVPAVPPIVAATPTPSDSEPPPPEPSPAVSPSETPAETTPATSQPSTTIPIRTPVPTAPQPYASADPGLKWLADNQEEDGHWDTKKWGGNGDYDPGICGLALLTFIRYENSENTGKYSKVVAKAVEWLSKQQDRKGNFAPRTTMYSHAIPTLALLELAAISKVPQTKEIAKKGFDYMLSARNDNKAWRYWPKDNDNDTSITTWCVMVLQAAENVGFEVPANAWAGVNNFLNEVTEPNTGEVGYTARPITDTTEQPYQRYSMTAPGMLCRLFLGVSKENSLIKNGLLILMENLPEWTQPGIGAQFYYYWFHGTHVMSRIEGDLWKKWGTRMRDTLVSHENATSGASYGSWDPSPSTHFCQMGGRVYATTLALLTLELCYSNGIPEAGSLKGSPNETPRGRPDITPTPGWLYGDDFPPRPAGSC
ncbi:MAG: hypothetical protein WC712_10700, partial [Candidatus Brocadiia bacterium]